MKHPNQSLRRFVRLGCAALALALAVGTVPFLRGFAAEGETVPSGAIAVKSNVVTPGDVSASSITATAEPKQLLDGDGSTVHTYTKDGFTATFDTATGVLTITGTGTLPESFIQSARNIGALYDYFGGTNQPNVKKIIIDGDITEIGERAFEYFGGSTDGDTTVEVKGKVTKVNNFAFAWTVHIDHVIFGSDVTEIGDNVFWHASAIRSITFPKSVKILGISDRVFGFCSSLTDIYIESLSLESCSKIINYNNICNVHLPCEHFKIGDKDFTYILEHKSDYFDNANVVLPEDNTELRDQKEPACTEKGYSGDEICKGCGLLLNAGAETDALGHDWGEWTVTLSPHCSREGEKTRVCSRDNSHIDTQTIDIDPDAHDWGDWAVTKAPTDAEDGEETRVCGRDDSHTETRSVKYVFTGDNSFNWTKGSSKGMTVIVKNVGENADDSTTYDRFKSVSIDGKPCADFTKEPGSVKITLSPDALNALKKGEHTVQVELDLGIAVISVEHSFTIVKPSPGPSSPATGESGMMTTFCVALMLIAAYGAVYALTRRKTENAG